MTTLQKAELSILITIIILAILLLISLIYYKKFIHPYRHLSCWKVRRPSFLLFWIIITTAADLVNNIARLMLHLNIFSHLTQYIITAIVLYHGGLTFGIVRAWLLFYDLKMCKGQQRALLSSRLSDNPSAQLTHISISTVGEGRKHKSGSSKVITFRLLLVVTPLCILTVLIAIVASIQLSKMVMILYTLLVVIAYAYLLFSILCNCHCCCFDPMRSTFKSSPFRDDWSLLLELSLLWISWIIGLIVAFLITMRNEHSVAVIKMSWLFTVIRLTILMLTFFIPHRSTKKIMSTRSRKRKKTDFKMLRKILSRKSTFYAFVEHLVHEFCLENLTFLVEVWQFKYQEKFHLKPSKDINTNRNVQQHHLSLDISANDKWTGEISRDESSVQSNETETEIQADKIWEEFANKFLSELPWSELPLAHSIALHLQNKWSQCNAVYVKFLNTDAYEAVNIGYSARNEMHYRYSLLKRYKDYCEPKVPVIVTPTESSIIPVIDMINMEIVDHDQIKNEEEFNEVLLSVFDSALKDILQNLIDSLYRFSRTEQFKMAH